MTNKAIENQNILETFFNIFISHINSWKRDSKV